MQLFDFIQSNAKRLSTCGGNSTHKTHCQYPAPRVKAMSYRCAGFFASLPSFYSYIRKASSSGDCRAVDGGTGSFGTRPPDVAYWHNECRAAPGLTEAAAVAPRLLLEVCGEGGGGVRGRKEGVQWEGWGDSRWLVSLLCLVCFLSCLVWFGGLDWHRSELGRRKNVCTFILFLITYYNMNVIIFCN